MENDSKFQGGGTPIGSIIQPPQQQVQPPQHLMPRETQMSHQQPPQHLIQPQQMMTQHQQRMPHPPVKSVTADSFKETMGLTIIQFVIIIILITLVNSPFVIQFEKQMLPISLRMGDPPMVAIFFNSIIITLLYVGINKLCDKLKN